VQKTIFIIILLTALFPSMRIAEERQELYGPRVVPIPEINVTIIEDEEIIDIQRISFYNPVVWQTDGDPSVSSCGPNVTNQIAVSQDLFFDDNGVKHLCGKTVTIVTHDGMVFDNYVIWDTIILGSRILWILCFLILIIWLQWSWVLLMGFYIFTIDFSAEFSYTI